MIKRIIGTLLALWGLALLLKNFFLNPTIFMLIHFYGFTPYIIGQIAAIIIGFMMVLFGINCAVNHAKK